MIVYTIYYIVLSYYIFKNYTLAARLDVILKDCLNSSSDLCGICGRTSINTPEMCVYPFSYRFEVEDKSNGQCNPSGGTCSEITSHCKADSCLNDGNCQEGFGTFRCKCTDSHYGMRCEHLKEDTKKYASGIQVFLSQKVRFNTNATLIISTDESGSDLFIKMESNLFHLNYVDTPDYGLKSYTPDMRQRYCKDKTGLSDSQCTFIRTATNDIYSMMYNFPVIDSSMGPLLFKGDHFPSTESEKRIGYVANLTITAYQTKRPTYEKLTHVERDNLPVFHKTYEIFVYYNNQTFCIAVISVRNDNQCTISPLRRPVYPPHARIRMTFSYKTFEPSCQELAGERQISDELIVRSVYPHYFENGADILHYEWKPWQTVHIHDSHTIETGIVSYEYIGHINNSRFNIEIIKSLKKYSEFTPPSFSRCFIEIKRELLTPEINKGINQSFFINTEDGLIIDARRSTNLNRRDKMRLMKWSCKFGSTDTPCFTQSMFDDTADYFTFGANVLEVDQVYNFSLKLYEENFELSASYAHIAVEVGTNKIVIHLSCPECWGGIIAKPNDYNILVLQHVSGKKYKAGEFLYSWRYKEVDESDYKSANDIRVGETEELIFKIDKHSLDYSKSYEFIVSIEDQPDVYAKLTIKVPKKHFHDCDISPKEGIRGVTLFDITCLVSADDGVTYVYEFFDKNETDEEMFSGRMLGTSVTGDLHKFRLTRGTVAVVSFDTRKISEEVNITVTLIPFDKPVSYIDGLINIIKSDEPYEMTGIYHLKNPQRDLALTSVIAEILITDMNRNDLIRHLIYHIFESDMSYISEVKLCLSSIRNILVAMFQTLHDLILAADVAKHCADVILKISTDLVYRVDHAEYEKTISEFVCDQLARYVLDSVEIVVNYKNKEVLNNIEEFVNPVILDLVQQTSNELVKSLDKTSHMLLRLRTPGDSPLELSSLGKEITAWVKVGHPKDIQNITESTALFPLSISKDLLETMRYDTYLGVQFILMNVNPFWWAGGNIVTQVLFVILCDKNPDTMDYLRIHNLPHPIKLNYNITASVNSIQPISGEVKELSKSMTEVDFTLVVYRFDPPGRAKLFIKFLFDKNEEFKVLFKKNSRPDHLDMVHEALLINKNNSIYNLSYEKNDEDNIYYMGILPVISSKDNSGASNLYFKLSIYYTKCKIWLKWQWTDRGCWVGEATDEKTLHCDCSHLSLFAGTVLIPPYDKIDFWDFNLFLTPQVNYLPSITLCFIIIIYVILFIWSKLTDGRDSGRNYIILLEDNFPGDKYGYLIAVYTGSRVRSGTNANVGVKIKGIKARSRSHILKCSTRSTLRTNSDDWFLIFCPVHLGKITGLHLWHDNTMNNPDWFLDKVKVIDLTEELEYTFYVYEWIAFNLEMFPEVFVAPVRFQDCLKKNHKFTESMVAGFRDSHYWTSIIWRHPRDPMTRVFRLQVVFSFVMTSMSASILLHLVKSTFTNDEDEPSYKLTIFDCWVLVISFLSALLVSCLTMFLLSNSFSSKYNRNLSSPVVQNETGSTFEDQLLKNSDKLSSFENFNSVISNSKQNGLFIDVNDPKEQKKVAACKRLRLLIYKLVCRSPLAPLQLKDSRKTIFVRKHCLVCMLLVCATTTFICCTAVLLFGWKLETVHGHQWLSIFILTLIIDIFVFSIVKLMITSAILSLLFRKTISIDIYSLDPKEGVNEELIGDPDKLRLLSSLRGQQMYIPLTNDIKDIYFTKLYRRLRWETIFDFFLIILFLTIMAMVTAIFTTVVYSSNRHATVMMSQGHFTSSHPKFQEVFNRTDLEDYLHYNFITQVYRFLWYNLEPLVDLGSLPRHKLDWTDDCTSRLVGNAYLRQVRVVRVVCARAELIRNKSAKCSPAWSKGAEDKETYYVGWTTRDSKDSLMSTAAWKYLPPDGFSSSRYYSASGTLFPAGGYFGHLGYEKRESQYVVSKLIKDSWLDQSTRAFFAELNLYNVNTDLFSHVTLIAEQRPTGEFLPSVQVESIAIDLSFNVWRISFLFFLILFTTRTLILINKFGFSKILSKNLHRLEIFVICLGYCSVIMYLIHLNTSSGYVENYQRRGINEFFSFIKISKYAFIFQTFMCLLFIFLVLLMMCFFRFGKIFLRFFITLYLSCYWLFWLTLSLLIAAVVLWRLIGYLIKMFLFHNCTSIILHPKDLSVFIKSMQIPLPVKIFLGSMCLITGMVMMLFITSFVHYYKIAPSYKILEVDYFNFFEFLCGEIKLINISKKKHRR